MVQEDHGCLSIVGLVSSVTVGDPEVLLPIRDCPSWPFVEVA